MATARLGRIEKRYVHKRFTENVHISEIYREVPGVLPAEIHRRIQAAGDTPAEIMERYTDAGPDGDRIYLAFPVTLASDVFENMLRRSSTAEVELLERSYRTEGDHLRLDAKVPGLERHRAELYRCFLRHDLAASEVEEKTIADALEDCEFEKPDVFRGRLLVDPTHAYWFEHPNEHIPGMLLIEGGRQMGLAVGHKYGRIPMEGVHNVIGEISVHFYNYADISHEIQIKAVVDNVRVGREGYWTWGVIGIHFYQHGKELGSLQIDSAAVKSKVLGRIRNTVTRPGYRYVPHASIEVPIYLEREGRRYPGVIGNLNFNGFQADFAGAPPWPEQGEFDFFIFYPDVGYIAGCARLLWDARRKRSETTAPRTGFKIHSFRGDEDRRLLDELLKRYFYVQRYG